MVNFHAEFIDSLPKLGGGPMHNISSAKILLEWSPRLVAVVPIYAPGMTFFGLIKHGHEPHPILLNKNRALILNIN